MFWILHILVLLFFLPGLIVTIPLHLIYNAVRDSRKSNELVYKLNRLEEENEKLKGKENEI